MTSSIVVDKKPCFSIFYIILIVFINASSFEYKSAFSISRRIRKLYQTMGKPASELSREVIITNELGLHARSAAKIAALAQKGKSKIWIIKNEEKVDASSTIDILTLACTKGTKINVTIDDRSDVKILNAIAKLVEKGFGE